MVGLFLFEFMSCVFFVLFSLLLMDTACHKNVSDTTKKTRFGTFRVV